MNALDTRDLDKRMEELRERRDNTRTAEEQKRFAHLETLQETGEGLALNEAELEELEDLGDKHNPEHFDGDGALDPEEIQELADLEKLHDELDDSGWDDGIQLIPDGDFEAYAREYAEDIHGQAIRDEEWPFDCIDWEKAANALQSDYSSCSFQGTDYLYREA